MSVLRLSVGGVSFRHRSCVAGHGSGIQVVTPLFQDSTHLGVASAICSTLGTTPYFFASLPLLVSRVQVALHL